MNEFGVWASKPENQQLMVEGTKTLWGILSKLKNKKKDGDNSAELQKKIDELEAIAAAEKAKQQKTIIIVSVVGAVFVVGTIFTMMFINKKKKGR